MSVGIGLRVGVGLSIRIGLSFLCVDAFLMLAPIEEQARQGKNRKDYHGNGNRYS